MRPDESQLTGANQHTSSKTETNADLVAGQENAPGTEDSQLFHNDTIAGSTVERVANEHSVSASTVVRAGKLSEAMDDIEDDVEAVEESRAGNGTAPRLLIAIRQSICQKQKTHIEPPTLALQTPSMNQESSQLERKKSLIDQVARLKASYTYTGLGMARPSRSTFGSAQPLSSLSGRRQNDEAESEILHLRSDLV